MNSLKLSKRVIGIALSVLFVNAALAGANSDARIQATFGWLLFYFQELHYVMR